MSSNTHVDFCSAPLPLNRFNAQSNCWEIIVSFNAFERRMLGSCLKNQWCSLGNGDSVHTTMLCVRVMKASIRGGRLVRGNSTGTVEVEDVSQRLGTSRRNSSCAEMAPSDRASPKVDTEMVSSKVSVISSLRSNGRPLASSDFTFQNSISVSVAE